MVERHPEATALFCPQQLALPAFATTGIQLHMQGSLSQRKEKKKQSKD